MVELVVDVALLLDVEDVSEAGIAKLKPGLDTVSFDMFTSVAPKLCGRNRNTHWVVLSTCSDGSCDFQTSDKVAFRSTLAAKGLGQQWLFRCQQRQNVLDIR